MIDICCCKLRRDLPGNQRPFDAPCELAIVEATVGGLCAPIESPGWTLGSQLNGAARYVATKQCALGTSQNLDRIEVKDVHDHTGVITEVHSINEDAHSRLIRDDGACGPEATDHEIGVPRKGRRVQFRIRNQVTDLDQILHKGFIE